MFHLPILAICRGRIAGTFSTPNKWAHAVLDVVYYMRTFLPSCQTPRAHTFLLFFVTLPGDKCEVWRDSAVSLDVLTLPTGNHISTENMRLAGIELILSPL